MGDKRAPAEAQRKRVRWEESEQRNERGFAYLGGTRDMALAKTRRRAGVKKSRRKSRGRKRPRLVHFCPQCGQFQALRGGVVKDKILLFRGRDSLRP